MSREELRSRLSRAMDAKGFGLILGRLERAERVQPLDGRVRIAGHAPQYTPEQSRVAQAIEAALLQKPDLPARLRGDRRGPTPPARHRARGLGGADRRRRRGPRRRGDLLPPPGAGPDHRAGPRPPGGESRR